MSVMLAKSKAGHDKNHIYVVWQEQEDFVFLVNGKTKKCANPKKKKKMHIQPIVHLPEEIIALAEGKTMDDALVGKILELYNRRKENV